MDDVEVMTFPLPNGYAGGFIGLGTGGYYPVQYDNFTINYGKCGLYMLLYPHLILLSFQLPRNLHYMIKLL